LLPSCRRVGYGGIESSRDLRIGRFRVGTRKRHRPNGKIAGLDSPTVQDYQVRMPEITLDLFEYHFHTVDRPFKYLRNENGIE
jgi:hypothetical protein